MAVSLVVVGLLTMMGGFCIAGVQAVAWLKDAYWPPLPFGSALEWLGVDFTGGADWRGVQQIIDWLFAQPTSVVLMVVGAAFIWIGITVAAVAADEP